MPCEDAPCCGCCGSFPWEADSLASQEEAYYQSLNSDPDDWDWDWDDDEASYWD